MPAGTILQFRYSGTLVDDRIARDSPAGGQQKDRDALIAYLDTKAAKGTARIIPVRIASILESRVHGSTVSLRLLLGDLAYSADLVRVNEQLKEAGSLASSETKEEIIRKYWVRLTALPNSIHRGAANAASLATWEAIVDQLFARTDFAAEPYFYVLTAVKGKSDEAQHPNKDGVYPLSPGRDYVLDFYHYHPKLDELPVLQYERLKVETSNDFVRVIANDILPVDSPYDLKTVRLRTDRPNNTEDTVIRVVRLASGESSTVSASADFEIPVRVQSDVLNKVGVMAALTLTLSAAAVPVYLLNENLDTYARWAAAGFTIAANLAAAYFAAFRITRPASR